MYFSNSTCPDFTMVPLHSEGFNAVSNDIDANTQEESLDARPIDFLASDIWI